jgi:hypothetical protein
MLLPKPLSLRIASVLPELTSSDTPSIVLSIQILARGHGYERWGNLPRERQKLFRLFVRSQGVVIRGITKQQCDPMNRQDDAIVDFVTESLSQGRVSNTRSPATARNRLSWVHKCVPSVTSTVWGRFCKNARTAKNGLSGFPDQAHRSYVDASPPRHVARRTQEHRRLFANG